jgi:hypothetical protein
MRLPDDSDERPDPTIAGGMPAVYLSDPGTTIPTSLGSGSFRLLVKRHHTPSNRIDVFLPR